MEQDQYNTTKKSMFTMWQGFYHHKKINRVDTLLIKTFEKELSSQAISCVIIFSLSTYLCDLLWFLFNLKFCNLIMTSLVNLSCQKSLLPVQLFHRGKDICCFGISLKHLCKIVCSSFEYLTLSIFHIYFHKLLNWSVFNIKYKIKLN